MKRALLFAMVLAGGCAASSAKPAIHTHEYAYHQTTGKGWAKGRFHYGLRDGRWEYFDPKGRKLREGRYRDGVMHGLWAFYFENGDVVVVRYRNGIQVESGEFAAKSLYP